MHISDVAIECARECTQLSKTTGDQSIAKRLAQIAQKLLEAARRDAELVVESDLTNGSSQAAAK